MKKGMKISCWEPEHSESRRDFGYCTCNKIAEVKGLFVRQEGEE